MTSARRKSFLFFFHKLLHNNLIHFLFLSWFFLLEVTDFSNHPLIKAYYDQAPEVRDCDRIQCFNTQTLVSGILHHQAHLCPHGSPQVQTDRLAWTSEPPSKWLVHLRKSGCCSGMKFMSSTIVNLSRLTIRLHHFIT